MLAFAPRLAPVFAVLLTAFVAGTANAGAAADDAASPAGTAPSESARQTTEEPDPPYATEEAEDDALDAPPESEWDAEDADAEEADVRDSCDVSPRVAVGEPEGESEDDGTDDLDEPDDLSDYVTRDAPDPARVLAETRIVGPKAVSLASTLKRGRISTGAVRVPGAATVTQSLTLPAQRGRKALFLGRARKAVNTTTTLRLNVRLTKRGRAALQRRKGKAIKVQLTTTIKVAGAAAKITRQMITLKA